MEWGMWNMMELVDMLDLGSNASDSVRVQVSLFPSLIFNLLIVVGARCGKSRAHIKKKK